MTHFRCAVEAFSHKDQNTSVPLQVGVFVSSLSIES